MTMTQHRLGTSSLEIAPLVLGGNVFGWSADAAASEAVLDAFVAGGGNMIDTSDSYSFWHPGNTGGESETIIGRWLASRKNRHELLIASKVSQHPDFKGLRASTIFAGADASLARLGIDVIDLYYAHFDDPETPLEESIRAFSELIDAGKVRYLGISNFPPERIKEWMEISRVGGYHLPVVVQKEYSLVERGIETDILPVTREAGIDVLTYYSLARGFLTGKYRDGATDDSSPRAAIAAAYLDDKGRRILTALDEIAQAHEVEAGSVALAWLLTRPGVAAPIASARNLQQLPALLAGAELKLTHEEAATLTRASED